MANQFSAAVIAAPTATFIYQPGGTAGANIYTSFSDLMNAMALVKGRKVLEFDSRFGSISIPAGTWDMTNVVWTVDQSTAFPIIAIQEGATFTKLRMFDGSFGVHNQATATVPCTDLANGDVLYIQRGADISCASGAVPMFRGSGLTSGEGFVVTIQEVGSVGSQGGAEVLDLPISGSHLTVVLGVQTGIYPSSIAGAAGASWTTFFPSADGFVSPTQPGFSGTREDSFLGTTFLYNSVNEATRSTTSSSSFQVKTQLVTEALYGPNPFRVMASAVIDSENTSNAVEVRLRNITDGVDVNAVGIYRVVAADQKTAWIAVGEVAFSGASKTFEIQFRSQDGTNDVGISDARIEIQRVPIGVVPALGSGSASGPMLSPPGIQRVLP